MGRLYIYLHEWLIFMVNVGKYTIHGWYGYHCKAFFVDILHSSKLDRNIPRIYGLLGPTNVNNINGEL